LAAARRQAVLLMRVEDWQRVHGGFASRWLVKRTIHNLEYRRPSYRDWETRTQQADYHRSKARELLNWNPTGVQVKAICSSESSFQER